MMNKTTFRAPEFNWSNLGALPRTWRHAFTPLEFEVPCGGSRHVVRWTPDDGAVSDNHGDAEQIVIALSETAPICERVAALVNSGDLSAYAVGHNKYSFGFSTRSVGDSAEQEALDALDECDSPIEILQRSNETQAITKLVTDAFMAWLPTTGFEVSQEIHMRVTVSPKDSEPDLVGMMMTLGAGTTTRVSICVTDNWYDEVLENGVSKSGRFFLGCNSEGPVYTMFGLTEGSGNRCLVGCWGKLMNEEPDEQDPRLMHPVKQAAQQQVLPEPNNALYVCSYTAWSYDDENYTLQEGEQPACVVGNERDAESWRIVANFMETFLAVSDFDQYASSMWDTPYPEDLNPETVENASELLVVCVRNGLDPSPYTLPMATYSRVNDMRVP